MKKILNVLEVITFIMFILFGCSLDSLFLADAVILFMMLTVMFVGVVGLEEIVSHET